MTACRQRALTCAASVHGRARRPRDLREIVPDTGRILLRNVYGWFERTERGSMVSPPLAKRLWCAGRAWHRRQRTSSPNVRRRRRQSQITTVLSRAVCNARKGWLNISRTTGPDDSQPEGAAIRSPCQRTRQPAQAAKNRTHSIGTRRLDWPPSANDPRTNIGDGLDRLSMRLATDSSLAVGGQEFHARLMFAVSEEEAAAIRTAFERDVEFAAAVELRRRFPGITDNGKARQCARAIAGWTPLRLPPRPPVEFRRLRKRSSREG